MSSRRPAHPVAAPFTSSTATRFDPAWLARRLRELIGPLAHKRLCLAYSGGLDSCALLCALATLRRREQFALRAVHINHQLHPEAPQWARQARSNARRLRVACDVLTVKIERVRGESLEALARTARYQALTSCLKSDELLLTAHHQEDQLETVLLALMRGSGVRGLAAMNAVSRLGRALLVRPLLPIARAQLERYLQRRKFAFSDDPSNADERFDRNYLRRVIVPLLRRRWPAVAVTVARSAAHLAQTRRMLEQLARQQLSAARDGRALRVSVLRRLAPPARANALRLWIAEHGLPAPDQARLEEINGPMLAARVDASPSVRWQGAVLRRHADRLYAFAADEALSAEPIEVPIWRWRTQAWICLGAGAALGLVPDRHGDVRLAALPSVLSIRYRDGGERLQAEGGRAALKDLLQNKGLAPWERSSVPLLMHAGHIIAVADLWLAAPYRAQQRPAAGLARFRWRRSGGD